MPRFIDFSSGAPRSGPIGPTQVVRALHECVGGPDFRHDTRQAEHAAFGFDLGAGPPHLHMDGKAQPAIRKLPSLELLQRLSNGRFWREPKRTVKARHIV